MMHKILTRFVFPVLILVIGAAIARGVLSMAPEEAQADPLAQVIPVNVLESYPQKSKVIITATGLVEPALELTSEEPTVSAAEPTVEQQPTELPATESPPTELPPTEPPPAEQPPTDQPPADQPPTAPPPTTAAVSFNGSYEGTYFRGSPNAPVTLIDYSDFL